MGSKLKPWHNPIPTLESVFKKSRVATQGGYTRLISKVPITTYRGYTPLWTHSPKRAWRPAAQRDLLAKHSYDSNFKWDLASKPEVSLLSMRGRAQRHEDAWQSSVSLPPSHCGSSAALSYASSATSCFPSPACNFSAVYEGNHWMRDGALIPMSDMEDDGDNCTQRTGSAPHIIAQGGEMGDRCNEPRYRAGIEAQSDSETLASVRHLPGSDDGNPPPLPGYSRIHFVFAQ